MIHYQPITLAHKDAYNEILAQAGTRGCEYSFANLYLWGRQRLSFLDGNISVFSQFNRKSVYLFPIGSGDFRKTLDAIIHDASVRDIPCRITGMTQAQCQLLDQLYPGKFRFHTDRNSFDYLYRIEELATLKGRKFQRKRNHLNRFHNTCPQVIAQPITAENTQLVQDMVNTWYALRLQENPTGDFHMEQAAIRKALDNREALDMEGLVLCVEGKIVAMTLGSRLSADTFDIHFEKALDRFEGVYAAINQAFAQRIQAQYPQIQFLNREDDMGLEGLRKAKMSYHPTMFREKYWACLLEDGYDY